MKSHTQIEKLKLIEIPVFEFKGVTWITKSKFRYCIVLKSIDKVSKDTWEKNLKLIQCIFKDIETKPKDRRNKFWIIFSFFWNPLSWTQSSAKQVWKRLDRSGEQRKLWSTFSTLLISTFFSNWGLKFLFNLLFYYNKLITLIPKNAFFQKRQLDLTLRYSPVFRSPTMKYTYENTNFVCFFFVFVFFFS